MRLGDGLLKAGLSRCRLGGVWLASMLGVRLGDGLLNAGLFRRRLAGDWLSSKSGDGERRRRRRGGGSRPGLHSPSSLDDLALPIAILENNYIALMLMLMGS